MQFNQPRNPILRITVVTILLAAICVLLFTACGNQKSVASKGGGSSNTSLFGAKELSDYEKLFENGPICAQGQNELWGYIDNKGQWIVEPQFKRYQCKKYVDGLLRAVDTQTGLLGFLDKNGEWKIQPQYESAHGFHEDLASVKDSSTEKWGFIDKKGNWVIAPQYKYASSFREGLAAVSDPDTGKYGFVDQKGKIVVPLQYDGVSDYSNERAIAGYDKSSFEMYLIDPKGHELNDYPIYQLPLPNGNGIDDDDYEGWAEWNYDYLIVGDPEYIAALMDYDIRSSNDTLNIDAWHPCQIIDKQGDAVFQSMDYNCYVLQILNSRGDLFVLDRMSGKKGIITINGEWIVEPLENHISIFADKITISELEPRKNEYGNLVYYPQETIEIKGIGGDNPPNQISTTSKNNNRLKQVSNNSDGQYIFGYEDKDGNVVIPCIYEYLNPAKDWSYIRARYNGLYGILDIKGNWIVQPQFLNIEY